MKYGVPLFLIALAIGCGKAAPPDTSKAATPTAKIEHPTPETELTTLKLSADAVKHLAIATAEVSPEAVAPTRTVGGEAMVPPGGVVTVTAPVAGTLAAVADRPPIVGPVKRGDVLFELLPLLQSERDARAEVEREVREADAKLAEATQRLQRLEMLLKEGSASVRSVEEARSTHTVASATAEAAKRRLAATTRLPIGSRGELAITAPITGTITALRAAAGQTIAAGAVVAELSQTETMWIRVPLYAGDAPTIDTARPATVASLGQELAGPWREMRRVDGPPAANPSAASVDLYFELPPGLPIRPGERLAVRLPLKGGGTERAIVIPRSAVVYDLTGGTWVYEAKGPTVFARRRVELAGPAGSGVVVRRGLSAGTRIVTVGAAELYGTEFFVSK